ncbi:hypothetical protein [Streptomyces sp. MMG1121]|uniref:hypothetical protein n=1 Tax=Streptomyces sp. MMG1121 TaxID=1415544 RepID=UPI0006AF8303|nr:hypothetical protein [Streptomyces sp. MMG1121]KOV63100.1 hypothetical protein ADK64_22465 [Streptomyces sp. MMG1121]
MSNDSGISTPLSLSGSLTKAARFIALAVLVASYVACLFQFFPIPSTQEDLLSALRSDRPPVVEIGYDDQGVNLLWEAAPLIYREVHTGVPGALPGSGDVAAVEKVIAAKAGMPVDDLPFRDRSAGQGPGALDVLLPATYPLFLRSAVLRWAAVGVGVAVLTAAYALPRRYTRVKNRGVWFAVCLVTGFGFFAFLLLEPCVAPDTGEPPELKPRYAWGASVTTGVLLALGGWGLMRGVRLM